MPRFTNSLTGSVVNVDDATAGWLGSEWVPADQPATEDEKPKQRRTRKSD